MTEPTNREKVLAYLEKHYTMPLIFSTSDNVLEEMEKEFKNLSLKELIVAVLEKSDKHSSYRAITKYRETHDDCYRSVIDIWRHILYFRPEVSIFDVMSGIYSIFDTDDPEFLYTHYCYVVRRRVFRTVKNHLIYQGEYYTNNDWYDFDKEKHVEITESYIEDDDDDDEFGLFFYQWENI